MSISINVITTTSNKTVEAFNILEGESYKIRDSNFMFTLPYDTPYIIYIEPKVDSLVFTDFMNIITDTLSNSLGYIWIFFIGLIFFYLIRTLKNHV